MGALETFERNGFTVEIEHDPDPESPRDWTVGCQMVLGHRRYDFPNDAGINFDDFNGWEDVMGYLSEQEHALVILPVYMIDHSGLSFRVDRDFTDCDPGAWDSGIVGLAYVTPQNWQDTQGTPWTGSDEDQKQARNLIEGEVEVYGQYVEGDVYGYVITDFDGEVVESCGGFYGYDTIEAEAKAVADALTHTVKCNGSLNRLTGNVDHAGACPIHGCPCVRGDEGCTDHPGGSEPCPTCGAHGAL